jgi:tetratricopeptide (TPR) repeat protein
LVYLRSINNPFEFDDWHVVPQNPAVHHLENIPAFFTDTEYFSILPANRDYRPIFLTSMAIAWNLGNGAMWPFHAVSITTHALSAVWVLLILRVLFRRVAKDPDAGDEHWEWGAFAGALLFAVHPLASESVVYISAQSVALTGFFYLLSFLLLVSVHDRSFSDPPVPYARAKQLGSYAAYVGALLCKPIAVTFMLVLAAWELTLAPTPQRLESDRVSLWQRFGARWVKYIPYAVITLVYLWVRTQVAHQVFALGNQARPINHHYLTQLKALALYYLKLAVAPFGLNADIRYPVSTNPLDPAVLLAVAILAALAWAVYRLRRERTLVFWALWFPACLFVTTFAVMLIQVVNEHRVYMSVVGVCAIAGLALFRFREALPFEVSDTTIGRRSGRKASLAVLLVILAVFSVQTYARCVVWSSDLKLWGDAARNGGTWRAHMNYGQALEAENRGDEALAAFKKAVEMGPYAFAHSNLGLAYMRRGNFSEGIEHLRKSVELWPSSPEMHLYLARGLEQMGQLEEAEREYLTALQIRPAYMLAHRSLAGMYERQGRLGEAVELYQKVLELSPNAADVAARLKLLGKVRSRTSETDASAGGTSPQLEVYSKLYQGDPSNPETLFALAWEYHRLGQIAESRKRYEELLKIDNDHRQANFNLAYLLLESEDERELRRSIELFETVFEVDPSYFEVLHHIATAYWKLGENDSARVYDQRYLDAGQHAELLERSKTRLKSSS